MNKTGIQRIIEQIKNHIFCFFGRLLQQDISSYVTLKSLMHARARLYQTTSFSVCGNSEAGISNQNHFREKLSVQLQFMSGCFYALFVSMILAQSHKLLIIYDWHWA